MVSWHPYLRNWKNKGFNWMPVEFSKLQHLNKKQNWSNGTPLASEAVKRKAMLRLKLLTMCNQHLVQDKLEWQQYKYKDTLYGCKN